MIRIKRATDEMRNGTITPMEFLQKVANIDNKIMNANSQDDLSIDLFNDSVNSNDSSESESDDEDPSTCIICHKNKIEVLLLPCSHSCCCKQCWDAQKKNMDSKGRPLCPIKNCNLGVKKFAFVEI